MKIGVKLAVIGILSLLVGSAFASPLLIVELGDIRPYKEPPPIRATADTDVCVVYANFSFGGTPDNPTDISYFVVLNITNNSDEWAVISTIQVAAAEKVTRGISSDSTFDGENSTSSLSWESKGAWVDEKYYNLTWVPHSNFWMNASSLIHGEEMENVTVFGEGYWMEGVQLME